MTFDDVADAMAGRDAGRRRRSSSAGRRRRGSRSRSRSRSRRRPSPFGGAKKRAMTAEKRAKGTATRARNNKLKEAALARHYKEGKVPKGRTVYRSKKAFVAAAREAGFKGNESSMFLKDGRPSKKLLAHFGPGTMVADHHRGKKCVWKVAYGTMRGSNKGHYKLSWKVFTNKRDVARAHGGH